MSARLIHGHVLDELQKLDAQSVNCIVTSPPYWSLRDYLTAPVDWPAITYSPMPGLPPCVEIPAMRASLGLEPTLEAFIGHIVLVFREARRVLRDDGVCWVNMGDSYAGGRRGGHSDSSGLRNPGQKIDESARARAMCDSRRREDEPIPRSDLTVPGLKAKDMIGQPWRVAFALQADGWWLRSDVIWAKKNPMPESTADRPTKAHEHIFMLSKSERYWSDFEAIKEAASPSTHARLAQDVENRVGSFRAHAGENRGGRPMKAMAPAKRNNGVGFGHGFDEIPKPRVTKEIERPTDGASYRMGREPGWRERKLAEAGSGTKNNDSFDEAMAVMPDRRNVRDVWALATEPYREAHFACVDAETEALTPAGWMRHADLVDGTRIAAYDPGTRELTWCKATFHRYDFDGELVAIEKRDSSQRLTPNHRCMVKRRIGGIAVVRADELKPGMQIPVAAPLRETETGGHGADLVALLGWYVTEGERKRGNIVRINQSESANPEKVAAIRRLLAAVGAQWSERKREREWRGRPSVEVVFAVSGKVAEWLDKMSPEKAIDLDWLAWPAEQIKAFLDAVIDGDGHRRADGRKCVVQKQRAFVDALQMMALRMGWRANVSPRAAGDWVVYFTDGAWLTLRGTNGKHTPIGREAYKGTVWCPAVPTGFWLARRSGKTFITGNTFPTEIPRRCILATCPALVCAKCGAPPKRRNDAFHMQDVSSGVQPAAEQGPDEVLQQGVQPRSDAETGTDIELQGMQGRVSTRPPEPDRAVLQQAVLIAAHSADAQHDEGFHRDAEGLHPGLRAGAPESDESGLHDAAPARDGEEVGPAAGAVGNRPPQERGQERQPTGESGTDVEASARSTAEAGQEADSVPALRRDDRPVWACSKCKADLDAPGALVPGTTLDIFNGSGTTGQVALDLGRQYVGIDLSAEYLALTDRRLHGKTMGLAL